MQTEELSFVLNTDKSSLTGMLYCKELGSHSTRVLEHILSGKPHPLIETIIITDFNASTPPPPQAMDMVQLQSNTRTGGSGYYFDRCITTLATM